MKISILPTRSGHYTAQVGYFEETLNKDVKLYLGSKIDPIKEAGVWAENVYEEEVAAFLIYGIGMGYHIEALIDKLEPHQRVCVIDTNEELWAQVKPYINTSIMSQEKHKVLITQNMSEVTKLLGTLEDRRTKFAIYGPSMKLIPAELYALKNILERYSMLHSTNRDKDLIKQNYQYNNAMECENVSCFYHTMQQKPIIIVSAGPSLDKNIELLRNANDNVFIFSTGRTLKKLVEKNIRVNMFCTIDATPLIYKQVEGLEHLNIPYVFLNTTYYKTVSEYKGPKYRAYSMDSPKEQEGRIESGGSVATAMLDLAIRFGGNPIIFIGQDLAYTNEMTHCINDMGTLQTKEHLNLKRVKDVQGNYISTTSSLLNFKYWIEQKIRRTPQVRFINATEGGAYIEGCEHQSLKDTLIEIGAVR